MAIAYTIAGLFMFILIVTIPFGVQAFKMAGFALWPFGRVMVDIPERSGGCLNTVGNILWLLLAGIWLAIGHLISALILAITILGIPFAVANVKLAGAALVPFGRSVMSQAQADAMHYPVVVSVNQLG
jgi:uncharacterized membrane protein YccF (DUF307 family)